MRVQETQRSIFLDGKSGNVMENIGIDGLGKLVLQIAEKLPVTIFVAALSFMFGLALGVVIALVRIKKGLYLMQSLLFTCLLCAGHLLWFSFS